MNAPHSFDSDTPETRHQDNNLPLKHGTFHEAQSLPEKMKWRTTPFPWFKDILNILGESGS
jgi:hypothetical protein